MKQIFLLAGLLASLVSAQAAGPSPAAANTPAPSAQHPLAGTWSWTLPGKTCAETLQYRRDGTRLGTSGEEVTQADYQVTPSPSLLGFYRLTENATEGNGKRDCWGDLPEDADRHVTRFIQFSPAQDQLIVCKAESLLACFGPLKRVP